MIVRRHEAIEELREVGGEVVLFHQGRMLSFNRTATRIWDLLVEPRTVEEIERSMSAAWDRASLAADVQEFVAQLEQLELLESE